MSRLSSPSVLNPLFEFSRQGLWNFGLKLNRSILILAGVDSGTGLDHGQGLAFFLWNSQPHAAERVFREHLIDAVEKSGQADSPCGRNVDGAGIVAQAVTVFGRQEINFI